MDLLEKLGETTISCSYLFLAGNSCTSYFMGETTKKNIFGTASLKALREGATNDPNKEKEQTNALSSFCQLRALISLLIS